MSDKPLKGDLVKVKREHPILQEYWHFGVYIGNGEVMHVSGKYTSIKGKDTSTVHRVTWEEFLGDDEYEFIPCPLNVDREDVVRRAVMYEGQQVPYNLVGNNCEHFARWCHGKAESKQVQNKAKGVAKVLAGAGGIYIGAKIVEGLLSDDKEEKRKEKP